MNRATRVLLTVGCLLFFGSLVSGVSEASTLKLALKFRQGQTLRYTYHEVLDYTPPTIFTDLEGFRLETKVDFDMTVNGVTREGVATVRLKFKRMTILLNGVQIADLTVFPKKGEQISATIKSNGDARFYKTVYLAMNNGGQMEYRISRDGGVIATKTVSKYGSEKLEYAADLDEGHGIIRDGVPPTRTLKAPEHGKLVEFKADLMPIKLFEFISLPSVELAQGQTFSIPIKYLGHEKLTYEGQADIAGYQGSLVKAKITPWTETPDGTSGLQPAVSGTVSYVIDPIGKLIQSKAELAYEVVIPGVGTQTATSQIELRLRR